MSVAERAIPIPEGVEVKINGRAIKIAGPKGALTKDFSQMPVEMSMKNGNIILRAYWPKKRDTAMLGTAASQVKNMIKGVTKGFMYKLKIVYAHFPITVKVQESEKKVLIENFTGEKTPRVAKIVGDVKVKVSGDEITVQGIDLESVSQTAANIEAATKVKEKDQRVFLDGIYVYERGGET